MGDTNLDRKNLGVQNWTIVFWTAQIRIVNIGNF